MNSDTEIPPPSSANSASTPVPSSALSSSSSRLSPVGSVGRIKAPPVCKAESLKKESLSSNELAKMCWSFSPLEVSSLASDAPLGSSGSSAGFASSSTKTARSLPSPAAAGLPLPSNDSAASRPEVFKRMTSRTGRENQRWATDASTNQIFRLTTGCVPIMKDGRILFCSSSRKKEWILPKGGWEKDEKMEESATRETYEEAGVLGTLGPVLGEIEYETRKAKKRRLEREEMIRKYKMEAERRSSETNSVQTGVQQQAAMPPPPPPQPPASAVVSVQSNSSCGATSEDEHLSCPTVALSLEGTGPDRARSRSPVVNIPSQEPTKEDDITSPFGHGVAAAAGRASRDTLSVHSDTGHPNDDTASVASAASGASDASATCAYVRMSLFPLYVTEVLDEWPESGRARKVLDIDAAIEMMEPRPEFQAALIEVKQRGLHIVSGVKSSDAAENGEKNEKSDDFDSSI